jgi:hypothetical protein
MFRREVITDNCPYPFPLIDDVIKIKKIELYEAEWEENMDKVVRLKKEIDSLLVLQKYGEEYIIPF